MFEVPWALSLILASSFGVTKVSVKVNPTL